MKEGKAVASNDKFFLSWKLTHEKGIFIYLVKQTLPFLLVVPSCYLIFLLINHNYKKEKFHYMIIYYLFICIYMVAVSILKWNNAEKRYKEILDIREDNMVDSE